jgi:hypothetical protein
VSEPIDLVIGKRIGSNRWLAGSCVRRNPSLALTHPEHKGIADDPLSGDHELLSLAFASQLGVIPLAIK